jgi:hypothetical protein
LKNVLFADVVDSADVRVIEGGCFLSLAAESFQSGGVVKHFGREEFQTHSPMEARVLGFVNDTHPAAPEFFEDAVMRNGLPDQRLGVGHLALILGCARRRVNEEGHLAGEVQINTETGPVKHSDARTHG